MKLPLLALSISLLVAPSVNAQVIDWGSPTLITDSSNIITNGTYFDAINSTQDNGNNGVTFTTTTVAGTTFNALVNVPGTSETTGTDGSITLSSDGGNYNTGSTFTGTNYNYILSVGSDAINGSITLGSLANPLTVGNTYEVEVWDSYGGSYTAHADGNPALNFPGYQTDYAIGTFTASSTTFTFDYGPIAGNSGAGFINDVDVRDLGVLPEPSTYALMLGGLAFLGFLARRKLA